jgi:hypothetical protein
MLAKQGEGNALRPEPFRSALGSVERRFLGIVLLGHASVTQPSAEPSATLVSSRMAKLRPVVARFGGQLELFADGTAAVVLDRTIVPTDIAVEVARCALALREHVPGVPMAVAAGWGERSAGIPVGEAIDRAARLLHGQGTSDTGAARIVVDKATAGLLDPRFHLVDLAEDGFELRGEHAVGPAWRLLLGKPTPYVGRERDLALLESMFAASVAEPAAQVVVISGPAGIGKSRLLHEFREQRRCAADPVEVWLRSAAHCFHALAARGGPAACCGDPGWRAPASPP